MNAQHESLPLPGLAEIEAAAAPARRRRAAHAAARGTPLDESTGGTLLFKVESLQRTGSFKFRGAYNRLVQLDAAGRRAGVVAFSSGNHAQGVAAAARMLGIPATIVMPANAPAIKLANTRALGAEVVLYDRFTEDREAIARRIVAERGATLVPAYDDPHIVAGQGTAGLELMQQAAELGHDAGPGARADQRRGTHRRHRDRGARPGAGDGRVRRRARGLRRHAALACGRDAAR